MVFDSDDKRTAMSPLLRGEFTCRFPATTGKRSRGTFQRLNKPFTLYRNDSLDWRWFTCCVGFLYNVYMCVNCLRKTQPVLDLPCYHFFVAIIKGWVSQRAAQGFVDFILGLSCGRYELSSGSGSL